MYYTVVKTFGSLVEYSLQAISILLVELDKLKLHPFNHRPVTYNIWVQTLKAKLSPHKQDSNR